MDDFLIRALVGGLGVALIASPFGCFIVWRRMAYFGDTLAHSALLGVALGFLLGIDLTIGIIAVSFTVAVLLGFLQRNRQLASDTLLGILSHGSLAMGLVVLAFLSDLRVDLMSYLFGDILAITLTDIYWIYGGGACVLLGLAFIWKPLLSMTVHEELAHVEGVPVERVRLGLMLLIALVIATAMKAVGILLVTSLLIIPAAAARYFAKTPEQMAVIASGIGCMAVAFGLGGSFEFDIPTGPAIVVAAICLFGLAGIFRRRSNA
ncbi:MAG: metal ABC transporter permease [Rhodospirillales bacterium]|nr:metal ABC transporter permease [Rhodospirillales bacterium]